VCEAEQWDEALIELKRQSYAPQIRQTAAMWQAKIYLGMQRYQEVLDLEAEAMRHACDIAPFLAVAHARLGHTEEALHIAQEALRVQRPGAEIALGHVYFEGKEYDLALHWYEIAAQHWFERAAAMRAVGRTLIALGDYREACFAYKQAIGRTPFVRPEDLLQLATCLKQTHHERAAAEMEQLAEEKA
jgi:tetratricopeptide (TPR) repeat protein